MTRDEWLRVVEMRGPGPIPCTVVFSGAVWNEFRDGLQEAVNRYADVFEGSPPKGDWENFEARHDLTRTTDRWGCVWDNIYRGIIGQVVEHPLADWSALDRFQPPDPAKDTDSGDMDWEEARRQIEKARRDEQVTSGGVSHGFLFLRLVYLRGFENLMMDFATGDPRLLELIEMITEFNMGIVQRYLAIGIDHMGFADDLGMQDRLPISPAHWRRYIKPSYTKLLRTCRDVGVHTSLHSDGYIADIMTDLIEAGLTIINPQDIIHGIPTLQSKLKGKVCIHLDIDRQYIVPWGTPEEIDRHVRSYVEALGSPRGGLMLICGVYPGTPLRNIEALLRAMSRYRTMYC